MSTDTLQAVPRVDGVTSPREAISTLRGDEPTDPPIRPGETFDPQQEIANILKSPSGERRGELENLKGRLKFFLGGMQRVEEMMIETIEKMPDQGADDLKEKARLAIRQYGGGDEIQKYAEKLVDRYMERRGNIQSIMRKYPDEEALFVGLFGQPPVGRVEVVVSPVTIGVVCHDRADFRFVIKESYSGDSEDGVHEPTVTDDVGGGLVPSCLEPTLDKAVVVITGDVEDLAGILAHENFHALRQLELDINDGIAGGYEDIRSFDPPNILFSKLKDIPVDEVEELLWRYARVVRDGLLMYNGEQEELLAYLSYYLDPEVAYDITMSSIYHHRDEVHSELIEEINEADLDGGRASLARKVINDVFGSEYDRMLADSVDLLKSLHRAGFTYQEISHLLSRQPVAKWPKIVKRLT